MGRNNLWLKACWSGSICAARMVTVAGGADCHSLKVSFHDVRAHGPSWHCVQAVHTLALQNLLLARSAFLCRQSWEMCVLNIQAEILKYHFLNNKEGQKLMTLFAAQYYSFFYNNFNSSYKVRYKMREKTNWFIILA